MLSRWPLLLAGALLLPVAAAAPEEPLAFAIVLQRGRIEPATLVVPAGRRLKLSLHNQGPGPVEFENLELRVEKVLAPGARSFVVIAPLRPGHYTFVDEFNPKTGRLQVQAR